MRFAMTVLAASLLVARSLQATNEYWDSNGATAGAGVTPTGTWGTDAFWTTSPSGTAATSLYTTTSADSVRFSAGSDTVGPYTVTLNGAQNALQVLADTGELTLGGGTLVLAQTGSGTGLGTNGTANMTVGSTIQVTNSAAGSYLIFAPVAATSIGINGTVTASSPTNSTYIQLKTGTGTVNINTNLGNDANFKAALQLGGIVGGLGTLNLNGNQTLSSTTQVVVNDPARIGTINLGSTVNTGNAVQVGNIQMYSTAGNLTGAVINVNSAVANAGMTLRSGGALNVAGSLTNSVGTTLGLISDTTHGGTLNILNGGTASLTTINVVDGSVLTNAGTLNATVLTLGEATGNTCGKFVMGDATGVGTTTLTQITTLGTGTANAIVGGNAASSTLTLNLSAGATFSGKLGGAGANENNLALVKQGASALTLSGLNTYTGATTINAGTLKAGVATAGADGAFGNNSAVTMANVASANLDITGFHNSIGSLAGGGTTGGNVTLGAATLTVGGNNGSASFGGVISGNGGALIKTGTGTQTFTGANTYTGTTTISAGTLLIAGGGSLAAGSAVSVNAGTLGGAGTINGTVAVASGATLQAGVSLGDAATFSLNNNLTMAAGSILSIGLGAGAATHDILARTGSGTWTFDANQSFRFLDQGAVAGTTYTGIITGLSSPASVAGWTVANSGWAGSFSINGNNIDFALSAIPEPATWGLIAGAGAILFFLRGRAGQKCR